MHLMAGGPEMAGYVSRDEYPRDVEVADHLGRVVRGIGADNLSPWCLSLKSQGDVETWRSENLSADEPPQKYPYCPELGANGKPYVPGLGKGLPAYLNDDDISRWGIRGAINAGLVTFVHVMNLTNGATPVVPYNRCEER